MKIFFLVLAALFLPSVGLHAQTTQKPTTEEQLTELRDRIDQLEQQQRESATNGSTTHVKPFLNHPISFGGFFESALVGFDGPATSLQASAGSHLLGINIASQLAENIRFVSQIITSLSFAVQNLHNDPRSTPSTREVSQVSFITLVAQAYAEYVISAGLRIQTGLGYVPYGYALQQREPFLFLRRSGPQLSNATTSRSVGIANPLWMGVHVLGSFEAGGIGNGFGYDIYTHTPFTRPRNVNLGGRLWHQPIEYLIYGYSIQSGEQEGNHYLSNGLDFRYNREIFGVVAEIAKNATTKGDEIATSYYLEPNISLKDGEFIIFAAADFLDNKRNLSLVGATPVDDPYEKWIYAVGMNWLPVPYARYRATAFVHDYVGDTAKPSGQDRDYYGLDLSIAVAF